eukprot:TRINITY_DN90_c0_g1_i5.p1 TRINITY_DN90_c0_g1~~TRINITY_DN90_c0_g1_i5.p1  ORF type:complete len:858 (+),score=219.14 TRINITY_DN90_c0_g1_i5:52-2625(+)
MRWCLPLVGISFALMSECAEPEKPYWDEFIRRPKFADRLRFHPDTGEELLNRRAAVCNLTGTWQGLQVGPRTDEYSMTTTGPNTFTVIAVTAGNWSYGEGTIDSQTGHVHVDIDKSSAQGISVDGTITNCSHIAWANGWVWKKQNLINKVHVIFMNHLDIGYAVHTPEGNPIGFMATVLNTYIQEHFPSAIELALSMRAYGDDRFVYTTHPWLVWLYLNCPPNTKFANGTSLYCPTEVEKQNLAAAVKRGDIVWHDGPFNLQSEAVGWGPLFEWGLEMTNHISEALGQPKPKNKVYNLRDVPGSTRGVVPWLVKNGFTAITIGQNPGVPSTGGWYPHKMFMWKDLATDTEILMMNHAGGYPGVAGPDAEHCGGLCRDDCMMFDGFDEALCFAFRIDNSGPPVSAQEVLNVYEILRVEFPGADVFASTLQDFSATVNNSKLRSTLPVVTQEVGDTWINGVPGDVLLVAQYRAFLRELESCVTCNISDPRMYNMTRMLLTVPEHTAGLAGVVDWDTWSNKAFATARFEAGWASQTNSYIERRAWIPYAVEALENHPVRKRVEAALTELENVKEPNLSGYRKEKLGDTFTCHGVHYKFTSSCGLERAFLGGKEWASKSNVLGDIVYSTYTNADFTRMAVPYVGPWGDTCGFYKPNMTENANTTRGDYRPMNADGHVWVKPNHCEALCKVTYPSNVHTKYGAPSHTWVSVEVADKDTINLEMLNFNKTMTRLTEALHYSFYPVRDGGYTWTLHKLGQEISPYDTILNGNPKQHCVWPGVTYGDLAINALDASVVSPITADAPPTPFLFDLHPLQADSITGMGYNLWNNIWETNYVMYYPFDQTRPSDANIKSRYTLKVNNV